MLHYIFAIAAYASLAHGFLNAQPPAEDQCQSINATEPPQCPQTIGPPCPPCITNTMSDYTPGDNATISNELQSILSMFINEYATYWLDHYGPGVLYPNTSDLAAATWVEGDAGRSQLFLRLYYYTNNITYFNIAKEYFTHGMSIIPSTQKTADFFTSQVGLWTVGAVINDLEFQITHSKQPRNVAKNEKIAKNTKNTKNSQNRNAFFGKNATKNAVKYDASSDEYLALVRSTLEDVVAGIMSNSNKSPEYGINLESATIFDGLSGALYAAMLINKYFDNTTLISPLIISNISYYLLDFGISLAEEHGNKDYLIYPTGFTADCFMPGAAHGSSGVVNQIFNSYLNGYVPELFSVHNGIYYDYLEHTLDYYVNIQLPDGNIPEFLYNDTVCVVEAEELGFGNDTDSRVQWCHGAPGFLDTIPKGALIWSTLMTQQTTQTTETAMVSNVTLMESVSKWLNGSLKALNATWQRGLLTKGLMMCHGIGGNAYTMLQFSENINGIVNNVVSSGMSKEWNEIWNEKKKKNKEFEGKYGMRFGLQLDDLEYYREQSAWRAGQFVQWTLNEYHDSKLRTEYSDENGSPWLGSYSIPFIWIQAMQKGWPYSQPVCMPAWDLCIP